MVAEVVRLLGYTENARILTNSATEILNGVARRGCTRDVLRGVDNLYNPFGVNVVVHAIPGCAARPWALEYNGFAVSVETRSTPRHQTPYFSGHGARITQLGVGSYGPLASTYVRLVCLYYLEK